MSSDNFRHGIMSGCRWCVRLLAATAIAAHFLLILGEVTHLTGWMAATGRFRSLLGLGEYYSAVTFANRNFGFFAPSVTPDWNLRMITTDTSGAREEFSLSPVGREMEVKLYSMLGRFSENDDTMDLFARSWSVYAMNQVPRARKVEIEVTRNVIPSMREYEQGARVSEQPFYRTVFER